jgi:hypothetical protein
MCDRPKLLCLHLMSIRDRHGRPSRAASRRGERSLSLQLEWERVNVLDVKPAAEGLVHVTIDAGDVMGGYNMPGQYVQVSARAGG